MKPYNDFAKIVHREGYIFIIIFLTITFVLGSFSATLGWVGTICTIWCAYFFRNPNRMTPLADEIVVAAADGVVQQIVETPAPAELGLGAEDMVRISIFLNIFNVHVNRIPVGGTIKALKYHPGRFFNASFDKASIHNERQSIVIETPDKIKIVCVQIAGLIARRIVCDVEAGQEVVVGERYGIIRFGSRVDVYLPLKTNIKVAVGQTCIGGETIIADLGKKKLPEMKFLQH